MRLSGAAIKQLTLSLGIYRPARAINRFFAGSASRNDHKAILSTFIRPGDLAFDVGANIGERTELMLSMGANVISFEPQPLLAREVRARGSKRRLTVIEAAVGEHPGTADLHLTHSTGMASLLANWVDGSDHTGKLSTPVITLDHAIAQFGVPSFCKIDVEGFETRVLKGLSSALPCLSFEYHCANETGIAQVRECLQLLTRLSDYEFNLTGTEAGQWLSTNWLSHLEFDEKFPACAGDHTYGDIFARRVD